VAHGVACGRMFSAGTYDPFSLPTVRHRLVEDVVTRSRLSPLFARRGCIGIYSKCPVVSGTMISIALL